MKPAGKDSENIPMNHFVAMLFDGCGPSPPEIVDMVSELGIFGAIIGSKDKIMYNHQVGHMLRTKVSSANEGGVAAGLGALDSVFLSNDF